MKRYLLLIAAVAWTGSTSGQLLNVVLDKAFDGTHNPSVAVSPRNANHIVITAENRVYISHDGGKTWQNDELTLAGRGPSVVLGDSKGDFYKFVVEDASDDRTTHALALLRSTDAGKSWSAAGSLPIATGTPHGYWPALDSRGNFYLTWTVPDDTQGECTSTIYFSSSKNGKKWSESIKLGQLTRDCENRILLNAMPAIAPDGKAFASWSYRGKVYLDRSFDGGTLWLSNDIAVADQPGAYEEIEGHGYANQQPVLIADNSKGPWRGSLYLVWADQRNGENDTDIWFTRTHNYGDNWSFPARVNDDDAGHHQYFPWITVDAVTGHVYIVYFDRRNGDSNETDVWIAWSDNGGTSFKNTRISETSFIPSYDAPSSLCVAASGGRIVVIWTAPGEGRQQLNSAVFQAADLKQP